MNYKKDLIPGLILGVIAILYFSVTFRIDVFKGTGATPLDSRFMPQFWAVILLLLSLALIHRGLKAKAADQTQTSEDLSQRVKDFVVNNREILLTFLFLMVYILGLKEIGFVIMTSIYLVLQISVLTEKGKRNYRNILLVSVISAVLIDYLFVVWLNILLPKGIIGF